MNFLDIYEKLERNKIDNFKIEVKEGDFDK